ncbi:MAG TPA: hypothetical protein VJ207_04645 [Thermoplasmata archaeon]|jgi:hypothetical protein|nr:hypothetical protein [Thermoplasmata archaeon]
MRIAMETLIERLAKKKDAAASVPEFMILPIVKKEHEHEGACGSGCDCGEMDGGGCCGG